MVVLATAITMGTAIVPGATGYTWRIEYRDGVVVQLPNTTEPEVSFDPRPGRCFEMVVCALPSGLCAEALYEVCAAPLVGDTSPFDGSVGGGDYLAVGSHWGQSAP